MSAAASNPPPGSGIDAQEWSLRVELAACYRIFAMLGWTELIYNHVTVRIPGPERHFLINPFGLHYSEVCASNLVRIDLAGHVVGRSDWPVNPAGFTIHAAIHEGIDGAHCVMHTHTTAGMAVACSRGGLSMSNFYSAQLHGRLAYHDFEGITVHAGEGPRLVRSIGGRPAVILRNHGLLSLGDSVQEAFELMYYLDTSCQIQIDAMAGGRAELQPIPDAVAQKGYAQWQGPGGHEQSKVWLAYTRMLDRKGIDYRR